MSYAEQDYIEFKDWISMSSDTFNMAITMNEEESLLGQYCYFKSKKCIYQITIHIECDEGGDYPALLVVKSGSQALDLLCVTSDSQSSTFAVIGFDEFDQVIRGQSRIGIAVGMADERFKVSRFSLKGSVKAIDHMRLGTVRLIENRPDNKSEKLPDGQYL